MSALAPETGCPGCSASPRSARSSPPCCTSPRSARSCQLLERAEPAWLLVALALQAATYVAQSATWLIVLHRAGTRGAVRLRGCASACRSCSWTRRCRPLGLSGTAAVMHVARAAWRAAAGGRRGGRGRRRLLLLRAYVLCLGAALARAGRAADTRARWSSRPRRCSSLFGAALATAVLTLSGRPAGARAAGSCSASPAIGHALQLLREADPHLARDPRLLLRADRCCSCRSSCSTPPRCGS